MPAVRRALAGNEAVAFAGIVLAVAIPTCWFPPGGQTRYLAAVYPCFAVLVGILAERATGVEVVGVMWRRYMIAAAAFLVAVAIAGFVGTWALRGTELERLTLPPGRAAAYVGALVGLAVLIARLRDTLTPGRVLAGAIAVAAGSAVITVGAFTDSRAAHANDIEIACAPLRERLPSDATVVGLGEVHSAVRYHLRREVPRPLPWEKPVVPPGAYFCFNMYNGVRPALAFEWEEVGVVSVDRFRDRKPECEVLVGRRSR